MTGDPVISETGGRAVLLDPRRIALSVRVTFLVLCAVLALIEQTGMGPVLRVLGLCAVAVMAAVLGPGLAGRMRHDTVQRFLPVAESAAAGALVVAFGGPHQGLLPYLLVPAFVAGLEFGVTATLLTTGTAALVLLFGQLAGATAPDLLDYSRLVTEWLVLALAGGLLASWARRLATQPTSPQNESYVAAYRLITQLRTVSRQLAGGLDAVSLAESLLQSLRAVLPYERGGVFVRTPGGRLVPLAFDGYSGAEWDTALDGGTLFAHAWTTHQPQVRDEGFDGTPGVRSAALPLRIGLRTFGLVGLEGGVLADAVTGVRDAMPLVEEASLRLETALLFSEVRSIATAEERHRLAREIHDGIAQELASLGYAVDDVAADASGSDLEPPLRALRTELTRIIGELRLSIFDLRSDIPQQGGLGAALSDYVGRVRTSSALTVHLVLEESPMRLPTDVEAELLRIAQEAVTNARRHAGASHLWVTCRVDPPRAVLRVEDDGRGLGPGRTDSFGLEIMRERAARLRGELNIGTRTGGGAFVEVALGGGVESNRNGTLGNGRNTHAHDSATR